MKAGVSKDVTAIMVKYLKSGGHFTAVRSAVRIAPSGLYAFWLENAETGEGIVLLSDRSKLEEFVERCAAKALKLVFPEDFVEPKRLDISNFPQREYEGESIEDSARSIVGEDTLETIHSRSMVGFESIASRIDRWEGAVEAQVCKSLRFKRWREWTPLGRWRYVSSNRSVQAVIVIEEEMYGSVAVTNTSSYILKVA